MSEDRKKRWLTPGLRNMLIVLGFFTLTLGATAVEISIKSHQERPLLGNVVALALLNINVLLLAVLVLLIGRQLVKLYFERKSSPFGAGYRSKLTIAFVALSIIPAGILFVVAIQLLTGGVKYWFGPRVEGTVRSSMSLADSFVADRQKSSLIAAREVADRIGRLPGSLEDDKAAEVVDNSVGEFWLELLIAYDASGSIVYSGWDDRLDASAVDPAFPGMVSANGEATGLAQTRAGRLALAGYALRDRNGMPAGSVVAGSLLPAAASANIDDITRFYNEYWDLRTFKNPLKESYALSLVLFMMVVVFAAIWFGLYMSKDITVPITTLAEAAERISKGEYDITMDVQGKDEVGALVSSFKRMARDLSVSSERLREANISLTESNTLLEQRRRFIETVLESVNAGVLTIDRSGRISTANRAAGTILGLDVSAIIGRGYRDVFEFHQLGDIREKISSMAVSGGSVDTEVQLSVNRRTLNLRLFISALRDADGGYLGILVVFDDLTGLIKAQRAAAWREAARRIAHEIKNPLTPIQLSAQRLRKRYMDGSGDYESIIDESTKTIIAQVESMKGLVNEFSEFARMPEPKPEPTDLHAVADDAATLFTGAHKDITVVKEYDAGMPSVNIDAEQMKRAMVNLIQNAVTALDGTGTVWIKTGFDTASRTATVEIADDGPGILAEDREKLFQPYFSRNKSGTGLGLAIVYRIVSDHGGSIRVEGNRPKGARFIIELPAGGPVTQA